jgi:hypothetical protein
MLIFVQIFEDFQSGSELGSDLFPSASPEKTSYDLQGRVPPGKIHLSFSWVEYQFRFWFKSFRLPTERMPKLRAMLSPDSPHKA